MPVVAILAATGLASAVIILGMLLIYGYARITLLSARGSATQIPLIGGVVVSALDGLLNWLEWSITTFAGWFDYQLWWMTSHIHNLSVTALKPITDTFKIGIAGLWSWINWLYGTSTYITGTLIPNVQYDIASARADIHYILFTHIAGLWNWVTWLYGAEERQAAEIGQLLVATIPDIYARIDRLDTRVTATEKALVSLLPYLSVLQGLQQFETGALGGLQGLRGSLDTTAEHVAGIQNDVRALGGLAALAGLSALEYAALRTLARNPCYCLTDGPFNDIPDRVQALENFGS